MGLTLKHQIGETYRDFVFTKALPLEELQMVLYELTHTPTGARVLHLEADDPENLFCLSLQTLPSDSTGVAHILEHTVLCGSKKFPVKDPFFSMNRRSLNTFMNAMTGSDFTCYPAASQVKKDFYNLLEVYLDAVFYPELKELSFLQEGHRLDLDPDLMYKGIVYNEMKGSLSNPEARLWHEILKYLTPDLTYAFESGGDPKDIPLLTYEQLKEFHATYYHPSRCIFFFYGNLPLESHLDFIDRNALQGVEKLPSLPKIPKQSRFSKPIMKKGSYPADKGTDFVTFGWLTSSPENQEETLALAVLDSILMENDASPLKHALLESELCTQADGHLDTDMSEVPYIIMCRGCKEESTNKLRDLLLKTLKNIAANGIDPRHIEGAIHQLEFSRLEITGDYGPFGLTLFMRSVLTMQHGYPPENTLTIYSQFKKLQILAKDPDYFPSLIRKYFLENPHFLTHTFSADPSLEKKEQEDEKKKLKELEKTLTESDKKKIKEQAKALEKYQETLEGQSLDCLPKIELTDVPKETQDFPLIREEIDRMTVFHHECFTNHIAYAHLLFDLPQVPLEDLSYLQLFISILPELGAGSRDYRANLEYINTYLGDFGTSLNLYPELSHPNSLHPTFGFKGKALSRNLDKLFALFSDICRAPDLKDGRRIKELILQIHTSLENRLNRNAMSYAVGRSLSTYTISAYVSQHLHGLKYFQFIRNLVEGIDLKLPEILSKFESLKSALFHFTSPDLILSCDEKEYKTLSKEKFYGISNLSSKPFTKFGGYSLPQGNISEAYPISSPVAFSSFGILLTPLSPALSLITELLENTFLHKKIREQGGAYGAGANYNPITGHFYLTAYRDPHIQLTFDAFHEGLQRISSGKFKEPDLIEAKLGVIQDVDTPVSPGSRAIIGYSYLREKYLRTERQKFRDHLLSVSKEEIVNVAEACLQKTTPNRVTFSGESLINNEGQNFSLIQI